MGAGGIQLNTSIDCVGNGCQHLLEGTNFWWFTTPSMLGQAWWGSLKKIHHCGRNLAATALGMGTFPVPMVNGVLQLAKLAASVRHIARMNHCVIGVESAVLCYSDPIGDLGWACQRYEGPHLRHHKSFPL